MPIYEFECPSCQHHFERLQKVSDADPQDCPDCGKPGLRRRLTAPAFRLSGSGWYETDFKKDGDTKRNLASSESASATEAKSAPEKSGSDSSTNAKPESKPATTSDS